MTTATAFEVVAEPTRRRILDLLLAGERPVGDLVAGLAMSQPGVSRHLRILRDAGLVSSRVDAQRRLYRLTPGPLVEMDAWLVPFRQLWAGRLDQLAGHLDDMPDGPDAG
jgi:DNA-binding transcriptional ArsR family regulator